MYFNPDPNPDSQDQQIQTMPKPKPGPNQMALTQSLGIGANPQPGGPSMGGLPETPEWQSPSGGYDGSIGAGAQPQWQSPAGGYGGLASSGAQIGDPFLGSPDPGPAPTLGSSMPASGSGSASPGGWGQYTPEGYDSGKMASGHSSPKYLIGKAMSQFDPSKGVTPELMDALNKLGIGQFSQLSGDKVSIANGDPRFEGVNEIDLIRNFTGEGSKAWQFGAQSPGGGGGIGGGGATNAGAGGLNANQIMAQQAASQMNPMLSGDPMARINAALGKIGGSGQLNIDALLKALGGA